MSTGLKIADLLPGDLVEATFRNGETVFYTIISIVPSSSSLKNPQRFNVRYTSSREGGSKIMPAADLFFFIYNPRDWKWKVHRST